MDKYIVIDHSDNNRVYFAFSDEHLKKCLDEHITDYDNVTVFRIDSRVDVNEFLYNR
jgi:hypothetical protein